MARIALGGFLHEVNSFSELRANYAYFDGNPARPPFLKGGEIIESLQNSGFCPAGFIPAWTDNDELVPLVWANGGAGGLVTRDAFERIVGELIGRLSAAMPVDGVYFDLHGAMVSEDFDDAEGEILRRARAVVGPDIPIVISLDYHANISPDMVAYSDAIRIYKTYPHIDRPETGKLAAQSLQQLLESGPAQGRAIRHSSFMIPLDFQCTFLEPSKSLVQWVPASEKGIISVSYAAGFPPSDTVWCGPSIVVHAYDQAVADAVADAYFAYFNSLESQFSGKLWSAVDGVAEAKRLSLCATKPIIIADTSDNPGAGGSGNTTGILHELFAAEVTGAVVGYFWDPVAARTAFEAGEGKTVRLTLGEENPALGQTPIVRDFNVVSCTDRPYAMTGPMVAGLEVDFGPMALVECDGVQVAVLSQRFQAYDRAPFTQLGVDLTQADILVLKSSCHFRADFGPLADTVLSVVAPGAYDPDPRNYRYTKLRSAIRFQPTI